LQILDMLINVVWDYWYSYYYYYYYYYYYK
jgi:hypothetical protein